MKIIEYPLKPKGWFPESSLKKAIVLHSSNSRTGLSPLGGKKESAKDVVDRWNVLLDKNVMPYLIDRDGTIIQTFPDDEYGYHLSLFGTQGKWDRQAIGIALVNEGGLITENKNYYINSYANHQNIYRGPVFEKEFRNFKYWADLDPLQVDALVNLIKHLAKKHFIEPQFFVENLVFDKRVWNKATIFTHANCNANVSDLPLNDWVLKRLMKEFPMKSKVKDLEKV